MPYKDPEEKRRYMSRYYEQKIKTGEIPSTAYRKGSYGLTVLRTINLGGLNEEAEGNTKNAFPGDLRAWVMES